MAHKSIIPADKISDNNNKKNLRELAILSSTLVVLLFLAAMDHYPYNRKIMKACGLTSLRDRRTFDRRLANNISMTSKKAYRPLEICLSRKNLSTSI